MLPKHLIIPDAHAHPNYSNERFTALGQFVAEERPQKIICIGDFADMPSLSSYDKGKKSFEGRRYQKDLDATHVAMERLMTPIAKARGYKPELHLFLGNHEDRISRAVEDDAKLEGTMGLRDLQYETFGWNVYPFLEPRILDGIAYAHYFVSGVAGRAIGGENIGKSMCLKLHSSAVQGHSHMFDHSERTIVGGRKIFGLSCGCFTHPNMIEGWNRSFVHMWWRGAVVLEDVDGHGYYDVLRAVTLRKLSRDFL